MESRWARLLGFEVNAYLFGNILIDSGFAHVERLIVEALSGYRIEAICCTHNHEDHIGNCAALASTHECPVYLRRPEAVWGEGVGDLVGYRQMWWGRPETFEPLEMPDAVESDGRLLTVIPAPGHSRTQVVLWEEATGVVVTGDLFVSPGATAVLTWENPWHAVASLRRVAALDPRRMLTGHGLVVDSPGHLLELKAERIESAARRSVALHEDGMDPRRIVREVFQRGAVKDRILKWLTENEFSRLNFVAAAIRHRPVAENGGEG